VQPVTTRVPEPVLVHPMLTEEQAQLVHQALITYLNQPEGSISGDAEEEARVKNMVSELTLFFSEIVDHPESFGLRSKEDVKRIVRTQRAHMKGPAQRPPNKRKRRQRRRTGYKKRTRAEKRAEAEDYNRAVQIQEAEAKEAEEAWVEAQQEKIARFENLGRKERLSNEEVQELLELFGSPEGAERMRELRADDDPQRRIDRAAEGAAARADESPVG